MSDSDRLPARMADVEASWSHFLELLSWWQLKRYFNQSRVAKSIKCRPQPDVVIVHPEGRFTTAMTAEQWREACIHALVAYCNHGPCCASTTFVDLQSLESLSPDALEALMHDFVTLKPHQRLQKRMAQCPPHLRTNYLLGDARRRRAEERKLSCPPVAAGTPFACSLIQGSIKPGAGTSNHSHDTTPTHHRLQPRHAPPSLPAS